MTTGYIEDYPCLDYTLIDIPNELAVSYEFRSHFGLLELYFVPGGVVVVLFCRHF